MGLKARQQKYDQFLAFLDQGIVMVHLDPRSQGVVVPPEFQADKMLCLNIAYGFRLPTLEVNQEDGIYAVLSFSQRNFGCTVPWDAIFALTLPHDTHEGVLWPEDVPDDLQVVIPDSSPLDGDGTEQAHEISQKPVGSVSRFSVVEGGRADTPLPSTSEVGNRSHLKLVES
jgi:stringent starvation protein B